MEKHIIVCKKRLAPFPRYVADHEGNYFLIVPDHGSGRSNRYTVYRIPSAPYPDKWMAIEIIGRELLLREAKKVIKRFEG